MGNRPRIVGVGVACLDYLFVAPRAAAGGYAPLAAHLIQGGGLVGTALVAAARLGAATEIWGWVGDDAEGQEVLRGLRAEGVGVSRAEVVPGARTPVSFIHVDAQSGERTIYHGRRLGVPGDAARRVGERPLSCDVLLVDAIWPEASRAAAARAQREGIPVVGDFCPNPELADLTRMVSALIVPRGCAESLAPGASREEQLRALASMGPQLVAITTGEEGCCYLTGGEVGHRPAFSVPVVDTTGAGDVFHGAFAYALARRWAAPRAVEFAAAAAALSCRALGGRTAAPNREEVGALLRAQGSHGWQELSD